MVESKEKADREIKRRLGIDVEHVCAMRGGLTYERQFYTKYESGKFAGKIYGWPLQRGPWCNSRLKTAAIDRCAKQSKDAVQYVGIAADEPERLARLDGVKKVSPLAAVRWTEVDCRRWCEENDLLSPIYATSTRGGCWFCHNQGVDQLRQLRHNYPDLWQLMLKWDADSVRTFLPNGHTIHDYDKRFQMEDNWHILPDKRFRWKMLDEESA